MDLAFRSKQLREVCESEERARTEFGGRIAESLKKRLADLRATTSPSDIVVGDPRIVHSDRGDHMVIDLSDGFVLRIVANHPTTSRSIANTEHWSAISRVKVIGIEEDRE